ncbi:sigma-70 family RNA polymerase sigma factor [Candidatus Woesearchaeota archaeon]|nr:sigma-70 family RNA polymerase sigma factor [Candidatus Woesearchaeota archaeon]
MIGAYLEDIRRIPLLTEEEKEALDREIKDNRDTEKEAKAREKLVLGCLRLVVSIASKYQGRGLELPDLIEAGNFGLTKAGKRYDPDEGVRFATYANEAVKRTIERTLKQQQKYISKYKTGLMEEENAPLIERIEDSRTETPEAGIEREDITIIVHDSLKGVSKKHKEVLERKFGLNGYHPHSFSQIGKELDRTKGRAEQIDKIARSKLRKHIEKRFPDSQCLYSG